MRRLRLALLAIGLAAGAGQAAAAGAEDEIGAALRQWTDDFNAGNDRVICDLFAPELRYDYRGFPERDFEAICSLLRRSLADRTKQYRYALKIKEILVSGDLAAVRLVWTLSVSGAGVKPGLASEEPGIDIFRKQPDGHWRIIRYIAYEEGP
jgi:ketosteroid isomerase-like protein